LHIIPVSEIIFKGAVMKNIQKRNYTFVIILTVVLGLLIFNSLFTKEIRSTKDGGNWCVPGTWVSGEIPGDNDKVIIDGKVFVNCPAFADTVLVNVDGMLMISEKDSLQCHLLILDEKDGKKGEIRNLGIIIVGEKETNKEKGGD